MKYHFYLDISEQRPWTSQYTVLPLRTGESLFLWVSMSSSVSDVRKRHHSRSCYFAACYALIHEFHRCTWVLCGARVCAKPWEYKRNWSEAVMSVSWRQIQRESFRLDRCQLHGKAGITESTGCWAKWSWWLFPRVGSYLDFCPFFIHCCSIACMFHKHAHNSFLNKSLLCLKKNGPLFHRVGLIAILGWNTLLGTHVTFTKRKQGEGACRG